MKGVVEWTPSALNQLAQIWQNAQDRRAINEIVDRIEATLRRDPSGAGESRSNDVRIIYDLPVGMLFYAPPEAGSAVIMATWLVRPGRAQETRRD